MNAREIAAQELTFMKHGVMQEPKESNSLAYENASTKDQKEKRYNRVIYTPHRYSLTAESAGNHDQRGDRNCFHNGHNKTNDTSWICWLIIHSFYNN